MEESSNIRLHSTSIPKHLQETEHSIDPETGELRSRTVVATVREEDIRCEQIINKLKSGELTLSEAVTEAYNELNKEYSEPLDNLLWNIGIDTVSIGFKHYPFFWSSMYLRTVSSDICPIVSTYVDGFHR